MAIRRKIASLAIAFVFSFSIVIAFCCCSETPWLKGHSAIEGMETCHKHAQENSPAPSAPSTEHGRKHECQCDHHNIVADLVSQNVSLIAVGFSDGVSIPDSAFLGKSSASKPGNSPMPFDTGPPGFNHLAIPLYLQVSTLLI